MIGISNNKTSKTDLIRYNPEYILDNICLKYEEIEELNGEYGLECLFLIDDKMDKGAYDLITEDSLITCDCEYGVEYFRIAQVRKNRRDIEVYARHITISEVLTLWCEDVRPTNLGGNAAINWIFDKSKGVNWLNVSSNIANLGTAYYLNKNVYQALFDSDNSFLDRWGGEVYRRGFNLAINAKVGEDRGVTIRSRKNLRGFEVSGNINKLATRIYPVGYNGITITEKYIDSPIINNYSKVYTQEVKFEDIRVNDENYAEGFPTLAAAQEELRKRTKKLFEIDKVDTITSEYRVDFVELSKTEEYKDYSILETTFIGDTIQVVEEALGLDIMVRVIKRRYDCLRKIRIETELSNKDIKVKPPTIGDIIKEIENMPSQDNTLQKAKDNATDLINSGLKDSHVIVKKDEILIMDTKDINTAKRVWRFNLSGMGYSSTGYFGEFGLAMTMDGSIVADFITTGILNANLIRTGSIRNFDGSLEINLEGKGIDFKKNGNKAVSVNGSQVEWYDWEGTTRTSRVGNIYSTRRDGEINKPGISLGHREKAHLTLSYFDEATGNYHPYIDFNHARTLASDYDITVWTEMLFKEGIYLPYIKSSLGTKGNGNDLFAQQNSWVANKDFTVNGNLRVYGDIYCNGTIKGVIKNFNGEIIYPPQSAGVVDYARQLIGLPYSQDYFNYLTNNKPPFADCSSLCQWSYYQIGKTISRTTYTQIKEGIEIQYGQPLQAGDMIFSNFSSPGVPEHVYMYSGNNTVIEAQTFGTNVLERSFGGWFSGMRVRRML